MLKQAQTEFNLIPHVAENQHVVYNNLLSHIGHQGVVAVVVAGVGEAADAATMWLVAAATRHLWQRFWTGHATPGHGTWGKGLGLGDVADVADVAAVEGGLEAAVALNPSHAQIAAASAQSGGFIVACRLSADDAVVVVVVDFAAKAAMNNDLRDRVPPVQSRQPAWLF